jgi:hypothetical protein
MIDVNEFTSAEIRRVARSAEALHPRLADGKVHERIRHRLRDRVANLECAV